jgi:hypothetical protein
VYYAQIANSNTVFPQLSSPEAGQKLNGIQNAMMNQSLKKFDHLPDI